MSDSPSGGTKEGSASADSRDQALIGRVISGRYRIDKPLAAGGMGAVFRGEHLHMRKRVAIKILHAETEGLEGLAAQFEREAVAGAHITHPNVAIATDFGELEDGSYFLVLEYLKGKTLTEVLEDGPIGVERVVHIARQIAAALQAVHELGIVHRDIKTGNIMLVDGDEEQAKLIDFGFAKVPVERLSLSGDDDPLSRNEIDPDTVFGTIHYLAPEALNGMDVLDARSDLYALGVIMYEMLTGTRPFDASKNSAIFLQHRTVPPPPFFERAPMIPVPAALESVVMRLLAKDPDERFQNGDEVIAALNRVAAAKPRTFTERPPVDLSDIDIPPPRQSRVGQFFMALLVLAGAAAVVWYVPAARNRVRAWGVPIPSAEVASESEAAAPRPKEVDGMGAAAWTAQLLDAPKAKDKDQGKKALAALAELDPTALRTAAVAKAAVAVAVVSANLPNNVGVSEEVFDLLEARFDSEGLDVLYTVLASQPPTSTASQRALERLKKPANLDRASAALRIALELRTEPCDKKTALFERAIDEGDDRALKMLKSLRFQPCNQGLKHPCCFRTNVPLQKAMTELTAKLATGR